MYIWEFYGTQFHVTLGHLNSAHNWSSGVAQWQVLFSRITPLLHPYLVCVWGHKTAEEPRSPVFLSHLLHSWNTLSNSIFHSLKLPNALQILKQNWSWCIFVGKPQVWTAPTPRHRSLLTGEQIWLIALWDAGCIRPHFLNISVSETMSTIEKKVEKTCDQNLSYCRVGRQQDWVSLCHPASGSHTSLPYSLLLSWLTSQGQPCSCLFSGLPHEDRLAVGDFSPCGTMC